MVGCDLFQLLGAWENVLGYCVAQLLDGTAAAAAVSFGVVAPQQVGTRHTERKKTGGVCTGMGVYTCSCSARVWGVRQAS